MSRDAVPSRARKPWGYEVPGGFITTKFHRGRRGAVYSVIANFMPNALGALQDIVILDERRERELFREGPYNNISVRIPLQRARTEIARLGLDEFLRTRQIENAQIGPLTIPTVGLEFPTARYLRTWLASLRDRFPQR